MLLGDLLSMPINISPPRLRRSMFRWKPANNFFQAEILKPDPGGYIARVLLLLQFSLALLRAEIAWDFFVFYAVFRQKECGKRDKYNAGINRLQTELQEISSLDQRDVLELV